MNKVSQQHSCKMGAVNLNLSSLTPTQTLAAGQSQGVHVPLGKALALQWTCRAYSAATCRSAWSCRNFCITGLNDSKSCFSSSSCSLEGAAICSSSPSGLISYKMNCRKLKSKEDNRVKHCQNYKNVDEMFTAVPGHEDVDETFVSMEFCRHVFFDPLVDRLWRGVHFDLLQQLLLQFHEWKQEAQTLPFQNLQHLVCVLVNFYKKQNKTWIAAKTSEVRY